MDGTMNTAKIGKAGVASEWRKPRNSGRSKPRLWRYRLPFDVAFDHVERCAATGCGQVRRRRQYILPVVGDRRQLAS